LSWVNSNDGQGGRRHRPHDVGREFRDREERQRRGDQDGLGRPPRRLSYTTSDGKGGQAYDVALARRLINATGLWSGPKDPSLGDLNGDAGLGRLANDPLHDLFARLGRVLDLALPADKRGLSYQQVIDAAKLDFSIPT
jgi:hypothetical protein